MLEKMTIQIPFNPFKRRVLRYLKLAPSQLTPNAWGFLKTFEIVMRALNRSCSIKVFFGLFEVFRQPEIGSDRERQGHVELRCNRKLSLFTHVTDSVKDFKYQVFYVRPVNNAAKAEVAELNDKGRMIKSKFPL